MANDLYRPEGLAGNVFRGSDAVRFGMLSKNQLRSPAWFRVRHDVYADSRVDRDHNLSCAAARLCLPKDAVLAGASAAYLHGIAHAASFSDPVCVIAPRGLRLGTQNSLAAHHHALDDVEVADGMTTPDRTAWDVARWYEVTRAVAILDGLLARALVTPQSLREAAAYRPSKRATEVLALADGRAQSPPESGIRIRIVLAGLPVPIPQLPVPVGDDLILHPDLAWPDFMTALEYDGAWHASLAQSERDRRRLNALVAAGWTVLHVTAADLRDFDRVLHDLKHALVSHGWNPATTRPPRLSPSARFHP
jgi:hypothetical protein